MVRQRPLEPPFGGSNPSSPARRNRVHRPVYLMTIIDRLRCSRHRYFLNGPTSSEIYSQKSVQDISSAMLAIYIVQCVLWGIYGVILHAVPLVPARMQLPTKKRDRSPSVAQKSKTYGREANCTCVQVSAGADLQITF